MNTDVLAEAEAEAEADAEDEEEDVEQEDQEEDQEPELEEDEEQSSDGDEHMDDEMRKLQNSFPDFKKKYRLIKRIGEGMFHISTTCTSTSSYAYACP